MRKLLRNPSASPHHALVFENEKGGLFIGAHMSSVVVGNHQRKNDPTPARSAGRIAQTEDTRSSVAALQRGARACFQSIKDFPVHAFQRMYVPNNFQRHPIHPSD